MLFSVFVLKNVLRRPVRSILTMTGMAIAVGAYVALVGIANGFLSSFLDVYQRRGVDLVVSKTQTLERLTSVVDLRLGAKIAALPQVAAVAPGLLDVASIQEHGRWVPAVVQGLDVASFVIRDLKIVGGRNLHAGDVGQHHVILGQELAEAMQKQPGDQLTLYDEPFTVVGVFQSAAYLERGMALVPLSDLQNSLGRRQYDVTGFTVKLQPAVTTDRGTIDAVARQIEDLDPAHKIHAMPPADYVRTTTQIQIVRSMALTTSLIAVLVGAIGMLNTMLMSVFERTQEIGILRAIGWRPRRVVRMILLEAVLLSLGGGVVGTLGGLLLARLVALLPALSGYVEGRIGLSTVAFGFLIALTAGLVGAAYPAFRGARLLPTEAIRHE